MNGNHIVKGCKRQKADTLGLPKRHDVPLALLLAPVIPIPALSPPASAPPTTLSLSLSLSLSCPCASYPRGANGGGDEEALLRVLRSALLLLGRILVVAPAAVPVFGGRVRGLVELRVHARKAKVRRGDSDALRGGGFVHVHVVVAHPLHGALGAPARVVDVVVGSIGDEKKIQ
ncbi:hypothetical protein C8J57DRAFT_1498213 [Mycena rebaudengoi]|nr:hypothetical protein C8J57DRAFT_1498213 [Mycena rebaudengoi]